uniref:Reticulon-like protein n=1 Tax=Trichuris muris TaxID=70415 RepID=A0A5S6R4Q3_TRIMR
MLLHKLPCKLELCSSSAHGRPITHDEYNRARSANKAQPAIGAASESRTSANHAWPPSHARPIESHWGQNALGRNSVASKYIGVSSTESSEEELIFRFSETEGMVDCNAQVSEDGTATLLSCDATKATEKQYRRNTFQQNEKYIYFTGNSDFTTTGSYEGAMRDVINQGQSCNTSVDETSTKSSGRTAPTVISDIQSQQTSGPIADTLAASSSSNSVRLMRADLSPQPYISLHHIDHRIQSIVYWERPVKSVIALTVGLVLLLCIHTFSFVTTLSAMAVIVIIAAIIFRIIVALVISDQRKRDAILHDVEIIRLPRDRWQAQYRAFREATEFAGSRLKEAIRTSGYQDVLKAVAVSVGMILVGNFLDTTRLLIIAYAAMFTVPYVVKNRRSEICQATKMIKSMLPWPDVKKSLKRHSKKFAATHSY